jgi:FG-GAP repeat/Putative metal-binding motif
MHPRAIALTALLLASTSAGAKSGSDSRYSWKDTQESDGAVQEHANLPSTAGTDLGLGTGDSVTITLPFAFPYNGTSTSTIGVHAYGVVSLGTGTGPGARSSGVCAGDGTASGAFLSPMWDDWDLDRAGGVYYKEFPTGVVIEWDSVYANSTDSDYVRFGLVLHDSGAFTFTYKKTNTGNTDTSKGKSAAIGYQFDASTGSEIWCASASLRNTDYSLGFAPWGVQHLAGEMAVADYGDATLTGAAASDRFGSALSNAGDIDGDGADDLVVGAPYADDGGSNAGTVYLYSGSTLAGTVTTGDALATIQGDTASDLAGSAVAGGGDVDGDGYDDVLLGAPFDDDGATNAGSAAFFSGGGLAGSLSWSAADVLFEGVATNDYAGRSVAIAGDVDADGYVDMLIGAPSANVSGTADAGKVYLILGGPSLGDLSLSAADATWTGEAASDYAGYSVSGAGDLDGDGYDDFAVGAYGNDDGGSGAGALYLVFGGSGLVGGDLGSADQVVGLSSSDAAGISVARAGDEDGDGNDDVYTGAYTWGSGNEGAGFTVRGGATGSFPADLSLAYAGVYGASSDRAGASLAAVDLDGNGSMAMALGAYGNSDGASAGGAVYLVHADQLAEGGLDLSADEPWGVLIGADASGFLGYASTSGDFDGDGFEDLIAGAYGATGDVASSGAVVLLIGRPTWPDADGDGFSADWQGGLDCDDTSSSTSPKTAESCDGVDQDCDGNNDNGFSDTDGDGIADCIDSEECDGLDNDGDGGVDEGMSDSDVDGLCDLLDSEDCDGLDNDGDGLADEDFTDTDADGLADCMDVEECDDLDNDGDGAVDEGYVDTDGDGILDCLDWESCDGLDNDGDGDIDEDFTDTDGDGVADCIDPELCDGIDNDGDGDVDEEAPDSDSDGICDSLDSETCDGVDNDGDGNIDEGFLDGDGDGSADCIDGEDCDGQDNNGDGQVDEGYSDTDGDGTADCVDEEACDGLDNDGDGLTDEGQTDTDYDGVPDCLDSEECDGLDNDGDGRADEDFTDTDGDGAADCIEVEECDGVDDNGDGQVDEGFLDSDGDATADCVDSTPDGDPVVGGSYVGGRGNGCATHGGGAWSWATAAFAVLAAMGRRRRAKC